MSPLKIRDENLDNVRRCLTIAFAANKIAAPPTDMLRLTLRLSRRRSAVAAPIDAPMCHMPTGRLCPIPMRVL